MRGLREKLSNVESRYLYLFNYLTFNVINQFNFILCVFVDFDPNIIFQSFFGGPAGFSGFQQAGFPGGNSFTFQFG